MKTKMGGELTGQDLYDYYRNVRGFDARSYGPWQKQYAAMIDSVFHIAGKRVLDVGCAAGAQTRGFLERGADVYGIEPEWCFAGKPVSGIEGRILLWPPDEPCFASETFDFVHSSQVLEHVGEKRVTQHFDAVFDCLKPGGLFFASLALLAGEGAEDPEDDVTHVTLAARPFWSRAAAKAGFEDVTKNFAAALEREEMYRRYRWDYFVWQKPL